MKHAIQILAALAVATFATSCGCPNQGHRPQMRRGPYSSSGCNQSGGASMGFMPVTNSRNRTMAPTGNSCSSGGYGAPSSTGRSAQLVRVPHSCPSVKATFTIGIIPGRPHNCKYCGQAVSGGSNGSSGRSSYNPSESCSVPNGGYPTGGYPTSTGYPTSGYPSSSYGSSGYGSSSDPFSSSYQPTTRTAEYYSQRNAANQVRFNWPK